ncbi:MAG: RNA polymerase sigma factor [Planctomycetes bacterium]|nr:RNA polymerase sigma factor [Planctomycetota bacterium]MBU2458486.1 RNA polymerase sigma factor [Planctomycetota bacterium]MBU2597024.1 RNA polymerase sigma factor [Planctomycetota bacterium]
MADETGQNKKESLIHRLQSGESAAFADFIARYQQQVFLCCRTLGLNTAETEDVASETFMAVYQGIGKYTGRAKLSTWLWKIAYNKAISFLRQKIRRQKLQEKLQKKYKEETSDVTWGGNEEIVWDVVKKLPQDQAMVIVLYYRQEKSVKEIASIMKKGQNTIKVNLFRGREKLKELLGNKIERLK